MQAGGQEFESLRLHSSRFYRLLETCKTKASYLENRIQKLILIISKDMTRHPRKHENVITNKKLCRHKENLLPDHPTLWMRKLEAPVEKTKRPHSQTLGLLREICFANPVFDKKNLSCKRACGQNLLSKTSLLSFSQVKLIRAQGGCLGTKSRRKT